MLVAETFKDWNIFYLHFIEDQEDIISPLPLTFYFYPLNPCYSHCKSKIHASMSDCHWMAKVPSKISSTIYFLDWCCKAGSQGWSMSRWSGPSSSCSYLPFNEAIKLLKWQQGGNVPLLHWLSSYNDWPLSLNCYH